MKRIAWLITLLAVLVSGTVSSASATAKVPTRRIAVMVTSKGFEPASIPVKVGQPVVLVITRTTERTCAKEIVIADRKLRKALPLNREVEISYTAKKAGSVRFACGMDMIAGVLVAD